jgi:CheY-like chemotaxis protein/anti-sigma regulatory factor (Ser/Thr protein kinase)
MLNDLLDFSKIEAGRLELEEAPFELRPMLQRCCALYAAQSQRKGLRLVDEVDPALPAWVSGDAVRLTQVLLNLVGNAVKFTSAGEVALRVRAQPGAGDGRVRIRFAVSDTGIGMNDSVRARLFQPFSQGDGSTTRRYGGTGLGLFICKRLVALMGGHFEVESAPERGSTFAFSVELGVAAPASSPRLTPLPPSQRAGRVLVAEDNAVNQLLIEHMLASMGLTAVLVANGREAVEAVRQGGFDAVLMDCHMPELDGFEATRAIRELEADGRHIPVVACSAGVTADEQARCLDAGMDDFLSKPVDRARLAAALARWLGAP